MLKEGRGVASKLQKKLIKNEKRDRREGGGEGRREWTEAVGGGWSGREGEKEKKRREGSSVLLKTGGQTVCNWLGPQGLKERFKERRER